MAREPLEHFFDRRLWEYADDEAFNSFDRASRLICNEWLHRQSNKEANDSPRNSRDGDAMVGPVPWLEEVCYRLLSAIIDGEKVDLFAKRSAQYHRRLSIKGIRTNLFQKGLMAIFAHKQNAITPRDRERIGKRLWHSYRHFVPPPFLRGFLKQIPNHELLTRAAANIIEPGFEDWIVEKLYRAYGGDSIPEEEAPSIEHRGDYPSRLKRKVKRRLDQLTDF